MDKRLIFLIVGILLLASVILVLKKCSNSAKITKPSYVINPRDIKEGDSIAFRDETKGAIKWKWNFGDGETSFDNSGGHVYTSAGKYSVVLEVYGGFGKLSDTAVITVNPAVLDVAVAQFKIDGPNTVFVDEKVTYSCNTPNVKKYLWRSNETGKTDTTQRATFTFNSIGTTRISLFVVLSDNSQGTQFIDVNVKNKPAAAGAKAGPAKPTAQIEADIKKILLQITNPAYNGDMPQVYYDMIKQNFCNNPGANVSVKGRNMDINSYCHKLLINKDTKITNVSVTLNANGCVDNLTVTQN